MSHAVLHRHLYNSPQLAMRLQSPADVDLVVAMADWLSHDALAWYPCYPRAALYRHVGRPTVSDVTAESCGRGSCGRIGLTDGSRKRPCKEPAHSRR